MASDESMTLLSHLNELRKRLFWAAAVWIGATVVASLFVEYFVAWLVAPLKDSEIIVLGPTEAPIVYFQIALTVGFGVALPYIVYQVYAFMAPGLYKNERSVFLFSIPMVFILFVLGGLFTLQVLIPISMPVLLGFLGEIVKPTYSLESYLSFVTTLGLWMGLLFQTPLVVYFIARLGFVTPKQLAKAWRIVVFVATIFAAIVTPTTDPVTMLLVTGPFVVLYGAGILLSYVAVRQRARAEAERDAELDAELGAESETVLEVESDEALTG